MFLRNYDVSTLADETILPIAPLLKMYKL